ncbi:MAG: transporter substrate-binding domain-containing protein [Pseudonocardiaceae bacterium]
MPDGQVQRAWPEPPPGSRPPPGARAWRAYRSLRRRGVLTARRLGCALLVLVAAVFTALLLVDRTVDAAYSWFREDPVPGSPFDTRQPSVAPSSGSDRIDLINQRGRLIVAVREVPGLAERDATGEWFGFDLALVDLIARDLGVEPERTAVKLLPAGYREDALTRREADLVVGGYQITDARRAEVDVAGPYLVSPQRLAVPTDSTMSGLDSLGDGRACAVEGSPAELELTDRLGERLETRSSLGQCAGLLGGRADAVAGDEILLDGLLAKDPGALKLVGASLGETRYGIGLPPGDPVLGDRIDAVLRRAVEDGTWARLYGRYLGTPVPDPPPPLDR